jgi:hypothetical protein
MLGDRIPLIFVAVAASALAPACRQTAAGTGDEPSKNAEASAQASSTSEPDSDGSIHKIAENARVVGAKMARGAKYVGRKVAEGARDVSRDVREEVKDVSVKSALKDEPTLDSRHVEVDVHADTKTIVLRGTVPTIEQKDAAGRIAAEKAPGYRVRNLLMVAEE